jgi:hypothetical protein
MAVERHTRGVPTEDAGHRLAFTVPNRLAMMVRALAL